MANSSQNDLVNQLDSISKSVYTDLDQQVITGARLKGVVSQVATSDCAIIVSSLGFLGAQTQLTGAGAKPEATLNGNVAISMKDSKAPVVQLEDMPLQTSLGTSVLKPLAVNFGSILKNGIAGPTSGDDGTTYVSIVGSTTGTAKDLAFADKIDGQGKAPIAYDEVAEYGQAIKFKDGQFTTKLEYATNSKNSKVLRYDMTSDFTKTGKTFSIPDTAQYNSYVLKNASGDYMGLVFCQMRK